MNNWKKLPYILNTPQGVHSLIITCEPPGKNKAGEPEQYYGVWEDNTQLGLFLKQSFFGSLQWLGDMRVFTDQELKEISSYIMLHETWIEDDYTLGDYKLLQEQIAHEGIKLTIEQQDDVLFIDILQLQNSYEVKLNGVYAASIIKLPDAWKTKSQLLNEQLLFFILNYMDEHNI